MEDRRGGDEPPQDVAGDRKGEDADKGTGTGSQHSDMKCLAVDVLVIRRRSVPTRTNHQDGGPGHGGPSGNGSGSKVAAAAGGSSASGAPAKSSSSHKVAPNAKDNSNASTQRSSLSGLVVAVMFDGGDADRSVTEKMDCVKQRRVTSSQWSR